MPTSTTDSQLQTQDQSLIASIREAHEQAQNDANQSLALSASAIKAAQKAGKLLSQARAEMGGGKYRLWCEGHFGDEIADKSAARYISCSQLTLALDDDVNVKELRRGMIMMELLPMTERETKDPVDGVRRFDQVLMSRTNLLLELMGKMIPEERKKYKSQFKGLYEFLKSEVFND